MVHWHLKDLELQKFENGTKIPSVRTIPVEHSRVHSGHAYRAVIPLEIPATSSIYLQIKTGSQHLHFKDRELIVSNNNGHVCYSVYEDPVLTDGTVESPIFNSNREFPDDSDVKIYTNPTVTSEGVETDRLLIPTTSKNGAAILDVFEWCYRANSDILVKIENFGTQDIVALVRYKWYVDVEYKVL